VLHHPRKRTKLKQVCQKLKEQSFVPDSSLLVSGWGQIIGVQEINPWKSSGRHLHLFCPHFVATTQEEFLEWQCTLEDPAHFLLKHSTLLLLLLLLLLWPQIVGVRKNKNLAHSFEVLLLTCFLFVDSTWPQF
jgi:hypothetical protein